MKKTKKLDDIERCSFYGRAIVHYTKYKPDCLSCSGYRMMCEQKGMYNPKWKIRNNLPPKI